MLERIEDGLVDDELRAGDEEVAKCFVIKLVPEENCRAECNGGDDADSFLYSFLIISEEVEDVAGVSGGGALLLLEFGFFDFDPTLSVDESCAFCATCWRHLARRFLNHTYNKICLIYTIYIEKGNRINL